MITEMARKPKDSITTALTKAEGLCLNQGVRFTSLRRRVLELVLKERHAVKAYELLTKLGQEYGSQQPPTIYRALDFLLQQRLVHRVESLNAFVACHHPGEPHDFLPRGTGERSQVSALRALPRLSAWTLRMRILHLTSVRKPKIVRNNTFDVPSEGERIRGGLSIAPATKIYHVP